MQFENNITVSNLNCSSFPQDKHNLNQKSHKKKVSMQLFINQVFLFKKKILNLFNYKGKNMKKLAFMHKAGEKGACVNNIYFHLINTQKKLSKIVSLHRSPTRKDTYI